MVEFALLFPLILGVLLYIAEIGIAVNVAQDVVSVSRESANLVYRHCVDETGVANVDSCVRYVLHERIEELATSIVGDNFNSHNGAVILSLYRWSVVNGRWERQELDTIWANAVTGKPAPTTRLPATIPVSELSTDHKLLIAAEAFYDYEPVALGRGLGLAVPDQLHHVTLF